jgi:hypothetical protein
VALRAEHVPMAVDPLPLRLEPGRLKKKAREPCDSRA